jgi:alpha-beta hydrolase superfamily lysophospholipase
MGVRGSRREKSVYTFGLLGRILWTLGGLTVLYFLLSPLARILRGGLINAGINALAPLFFAVAGIILLIWIAPRYIRDLWRPAPIAGDELTELRDRTRREAESQQRAPAPTDAEPVSQRMGPARW